MSLIKNKKAALKFSFLILGLIAIVAIIVYAGGVFANTHTSTITVTPNIVPSSTGISFTANVENTAGPDSIHEVRIYEHFDFSNINCDSVSGWYGPFTGQNNYGEFCLWTAQDGNELDEGESKDFTFSADTPNSECCREWLMETRDLEGYWVFNYPKICIDTTDPETTKSFSPEGTYKIVFIDEQHILEWVDTDTIITLEATDSVGSHDAGIDEIWWRNTIVENRYCESEGSGCSAATGDGSWITEENHEGGDFSIEIKKTDESCHLLEFYSIDGVENEEKVNKNCFFVDKTPPYIDKENPEEAILDKDLGLPIEGEFHWITPNMEITFTCDDTWEEALHPSEDEELCFRVSYDEPSYPTYLTSDYCSKYSGTMEDDYCCVNVDPENKDFIFNFNEDEDSVHDLEYFCRDAVGKESETHLQYYKVDSTPPTIHKEMIGEDHLGECPPGPDPQEPCYVRDDGKNGVSISVEDGGEICAVNEVICTYGFWWFTSAEECEDKYPGATYSTGRCAVDSGTFSDSQEIIFREDSRHELYINCEDKLGNKMPRDLETFYVDSTPPTTTKEYGEPTEVEEGYRWITSQTPITLTPFDEKVGVDEVYWRNTLLEIPDEACLEQCQCESSPLEEVFDLTGDVEGTVTKTDDGDSFTWTVSITSDNPAHHVWGTGMAFATSTNQPEFQVYFAEFSDNIWHYQDYGTGWNGPDTTTLPDGISTTGDQNGQVFTITIPKSKLGGACSTFYWGVQARTNLLGKYPDTWQQWSGGSKEVIGMATSMVGGSGDWNIYTEPFYKREESCHLIEYYTVDKLGNTESTKSQCVFVDNTPPEPTKEIRGPQIDGTGEVHKYLTSESSVYIDCIDQLPHPVREEILEWEMYWKEDNCEVDDNWELKGSGDEATGDKIFTDLEDSCHKFVYWCSDALGNVESAPHEEIDIVDNKAPEITKTIVGPKYYNEQEQKMYIDGITTIEVTATDPLPHPVDDVQCDWSYTVNDGNPIIGGQDLGGSFIVRFPEESHHKLTITCKDALGNTVIDIEDFYVDKTPPVTSKRYAGPQYPGEGYPKWITSETEIYLTASDNIGPHDSGVAATYWRNTLLVDDGYCRDQELCQEAVGEGEWNLYETPFTKPGESCHLIEYYSIDNVDKTEVTKKQCVFVDNSPPTPLKEVGEPKTEWDGANSVFYPEETAHCWDQTGEEIECWKVTLDTEIDMSCTDLGPHPVNHENICFMVDLDGVDETSIYCGQYNGHMEDDGFCCLEQTINNFVFLESSEHNLKFYCEDALGNSNKEDLDEEKFKVIGKMFEIQINEKWNLISFPFNPIDKNVSKVFEDIEGVEAVWTYDGETGKWSVYRPEGDPGTNDLKEVETGLGYWVLVNCENPEEGKCDNLIIGGSLYETAPITPPSKKLIEGWNLIGYYGTEGQEGYYDPDGNGKNAYCALYSLRNLNSIIPAGNWNGLLSYWEPNNPNQWDIPDEDKFGLCDEMDPGAGYWVAMDIEDTYNPQTVCNEDLVNLICGIID